MSVSFDSAKELFTEGRYAESKSALEALLPGADEALTKQLQLWIRKCNTHLPASAAPAAPPTQSPPTSTVPFTGTVRFEWFQTPTSVTLTFYVKSRLESDVRVSSTERSVDVVILLDAAGPKEYQYTLEHLFAPVETTATVSVRSMKVEVALTKKTAFHWPTLELAAGADVVKAIEQPQVIAAAVAPSTAGELAYPNSKGKDWNRVKLEEEEEKPTGDAALNALFKQIYGNGTDEQRKAMIKSFTESNGTVLSTNWNEVGTKKVVGEAPKGMEAVPFEQ